MYKLWYELDVEWLSELTPEEVREHVAEQALEDFRA